jgi:arsenate reductase
VRDWALDDPDGQDPERVREIRDEIEGRVRSLFDEFSDTGDGSSGS